MCCCADDQLMNQSKLGIGTIVRNLRDVLGEDRLPPLHVNSPLETCSLWVLDIQVALARESGLDVSIYDFGAPRSEHGVLC